MTRSSPRRVLLALLLAMVALSCAFLAWLAMPRASKVDFGEWGAIVIQSDDWGLEAWFPDVDAATELEEIREGVPDWLATYARSSLESADDVRSLAEFLAEFEDADGLPAVLQANTIVAGPDLGDAGAFDPKLGWSIHPSGEGQGRYARPGLWEAVEQARAGGVWWPELHGLTHFDLFEYATMIGQRDALAIKAADHGVFAYEGWLNDSELDVFDSDRASAMAAESVRRFHERFGRAPTSVIASDYRWGDEDEEAWIEFGLQTVQAKREQIDMSLAPFNLRSRAVKWWRRAWQRRTSPLHYMERSADLEPYGDATASAPQGAEAAHERVMDAWKQGQPGVISIHRAQLVSFDEQIAQAGRDHLGDLLRRLASQKSVCFLVDTEVEQLTRRGWSVLERGPWLVVRNWTGRDRLIESVARGFRHNCPPGTTVVPREAR